MVKLNEIGVFGQERVERIANEVVRRAKAIKDHVAPRAKLSVSTLEGPDRLALVVHNGTDKTYPLKRQALLQLAGSLDFPVKFLERLESRGHRDLVAATLSELLTREASTEKGAERKHLVRILDDECRAFLSDRFDRGIAHDALLAVTLEAFASFGAEVWDFGLTDSHFFIKGIAPGMRGRVEFKGKDSHEFAKIRGEDWQNPAVTIENSETGQGRAGASISLWAQACRNFAIVEKGVAKVHLGRQLEEGEQVELSDQTRDLEGKAFVSKVRDVIANAFDEAKFRALLARISDTTAREVPKDIEASNVVDVTVRDWGLTAERKDSILEAFLKGGRSQYMLAQALTAQSNPTNAGELDDGARVAFEQAGGSVLALNDRDWKAFLMTTRKPVEEQEVEVAAQQHVRVVR